MSSSALEKLRQNYQDIEEKRKNAVWLLNIQPKTVKEEAYINHHVAEDCKEIQELSLKILETLEGNDIVKYDNPLDAFNDEFELRFQYYSSLADAGNEEDDENNNINDMNEKTEKEAPKTMNDLVYDIRGSPHMSLFYDNERYQEWRRIHEDEKKKKRGKEKKNKKQITIDENDEALKKFSGEEMYGKFLDLVDLHNLYLQINPNDSLSYLEFLEKLASAKDFNFLPKGDRSDLFINKLIEYLISFIERSQPFFPLQETIESIMNTFNENYKVMPMKFLLTKETYCPYCNKEFDSIEKKEKHLNEKSHLRNVAKINKREGGLEATIQQREEKNRERAQNQFLCMQLIMNLKDKLEATISNTKRRQTISSAVIEAEQKDIDAPIVFDENESDDDEQFFNPKGLPLGWDGKPIPMWLYKLHGLSVEYKCEICGNKSYWGQVAFEKHFFQPTHINHLKMLGITNSKHFVNITKINDAIALFEKIKSSLSEDVWQKGEEEVETDDGTVMPRKLYEDMVRQGLIKPKQK